MVLSCRSLLMYTVTSLCTGCVGSWKVTPSSRYGRVRGMRLRTTANEGETTLPATTNTFYKVNLPTAMIEEPTGLVTFAQVLRRGQESRDTQLEFLLRTFPALMVETKGNVDVTSKLCYDIMIRILFEPLEWQNRDFLRLEHDDYAYDYFQGATRMVKKYPMFQGFREKMDYIINRTKFIESQLQDWLEATKDARSQRQVVLVGAGYDTRALRYRDHPNITWFEVDHPYTSDNKNFMVRVKYAEHRPETRDVNITFVPFDFNTYRNYKTTLLERLEEQRFNTSYPTFVLCESLLSNLGYGECDSICRDILSLTNCRWCITDDICSVVQVSPTMAPISRGRLETFFESHGKQVIAHKLYNETDGLIHFVSATSITPPP